MSQPTLTLNESLPQSRTTVAEVSAEQIAREVKAEQIRLLFNQGTTIQLLGMITVVIAATMFREVADTRLLLAWFSGMVVVTLARLYLNYRFARLPEDRIDIATWGNLYIAGTFVSGILWGTMALFHDPSWPVPHQIILFAIYTGIIAGAYNTNSPVYLAFPAFYLPPMLFLMYVMVKNGTAFTELALLFVIYIVLMAVSSRKYHLRLTHFLRLQIMNRSLTQALEQSNRRLSQLAEIDPLTQLYNRRSMDKCLHEEWNRHIRNGASLSILYIDIDHFKQYNDTYGHPEGDRCLVRVARVLQQHAQRASDMAVRFGGEEFAIILPETGKVDAINLAEAVRQAIEELQIEHQGSRVAQVLTVSIGVATVTPTRETAFETLRIEADRALYKAKEQGRNRVV